jgi:hypothetical protein
MAVSWDKLYLKFCWFAFYLWYYTMGYKIFWLHFAKAEIHTYSIMERTGNGEALVSKFLLKTFYIYSHNFRQL